MKNKLRKITVDHKTYLWKRAHQHLAEFEHSKCVEKVTVYLEGFKNAPLQLLFREEDNLSLKTDLEKEKWCVGHPDAGVIWLYTYKAVLPNKAPHPITEITTTTINLNRPAVMAALINYFNSHGWEPSKIAKPFVENNALKFLDIIDLPKGMAK